MLNHADVVAYNLKSHVTAKNTMLLGGYGDEYNKNEVSPSRYKQDNAVEAFFYVYYKHFAQSKSD